MSSPPKGLAELVADGTVRAARPRGVLVRTYPTPTTPVDIYWPQGWSAWRAHFRLADSVQFVDVPINAREVQE